MAKLLNGAELADYVKERQARQVRALRQAWKTFPKLVILMTPGATAASRAYVRMKQAYGEDILIDTDVRIVEQAALAQAIREANADEAVHGIIVQLPLDDPAEMDEIVGLIAPEKDVDGLSDGAHYDGATAEAINWLLTGYGIDLARKRIVIVGRGRLVGAPLEKMWRASDYDVTAVDDTTPGITSVVQAAHIIVTATGAPRLLTSTMIPVGAVVVDAGTASEGGKLVGDVDPSVRERDDITITPERGGVGPLTIATLFDHVIQAAQATIRD